MSKQPEPQTAKPATLESSQDLTNPNVRSFFAIEGGKPKPSGGK